MLAIVIPTDEMPDAVSVLITVSLQGSTLVAGGAAVVIAVAAGGGASGAAGGGGGGRGGRSWF